VARWKPLPEGLDPLVVQFVADLRKLKDDSGLSLSRLAKKTGFSASSWERYLGGRAFPPERVVRALATVVGVDDTSLLVLHQMAQQAWIRSRPEDVQEDAEENGENEENTASPTAQVGADSSGASGRIPAVRTLGVVLASALVGSALTVLVIQPWHGTKTVLRPAAQAVPSHYECRFTRTGGKWYAGNSTTDAADVRYGMTGPDVAELQCLLQRAGQSPGKIDGNFGPKTLRAVIQEQYAAHIDLDGEVGSQTWAKLRG
jgi:transcriptional regulator with XRE-family HTH domain